VNRNLATGGESVVCAIVTTDERRVVSVRTDTTASHRVGVAIDGCSDREQGSYKSRTHREGCLGGEESDRDNSRPEQQGTKFIDL
jgi:hypothetical protein